ncbi:member of Set1p complex, histone methyl transferase [Lobosporangium transversale]|nr:member of Set1p complex, histone methyl transferase [Lobosporangium transversale]
MTIIKRVTALEMSPLDDQFLAGSEGSIRLWDLRSPNCQGALSVIGRPAIAFDPSGLVFAVAIGSTLRLYDVKVFDQGPFETAIIGLNNQNNQNGYNNTFNNPILSSSSTSSSPIIVTQLEFSSDGKNILVSTAGDAHYIVDAYKPSATKLRLVGHYNSYSFGPRLGRSTFSGAGGRGGAGNGDDDEPFQSGGEACWTPDGKCVVSGSRDGSIYVWDIAKAMSDQALGLFNHNNNNMGVNGAATNTGVNGDLGQSSSNLLSPDGELRPFKALKAHGTPSHIVAFNPKYLMMVSGSTELAFWEPDPNVVGMDALHDFSKGGRH